jgi:uncharacterized protein YcsI (UPF0317 family)
MKTINKRKNLIKEGFSILGWAVDDITHNRYADELLVLEKEYEKNHRNFCAGRTYALSSIDCAKYWAVQHVLDALKNNTRHDIKSYIHLKKSIFLAESLVANYRKELEKEFEGFDFEAFFTLQDDLYQEAI